MADPVAVILLKDAGFVIHFDAAHTMRLIEPVMSLSMSRLSSRKPTTLRRWHFAEVLGGSGLVAA